MNKQDVLIAISLRDLVNIYGDRWELRELARKLIRSSSVEEKVRLLREFDEVNSLEMASMALIPGTGEIPTYSKFEDASQRSIPDVLRLN